MHRSRVALLLVLLLVPHAALADEVGVWAGEIATVDFRRPSQTHGPLVWFELTQRKWGANWRNMIRPAVGYGGRVGRTDLTGWLGYAADVNHTDGGAWSVEHRLWQMFQAESRLSEQNPVRLTERVRLEERWLPGSEDTQARLRVFARGLVPLGRGGWGLSLWDEAFFKLNAIDVAGAGFDQNRFFVGPYFQSDKGVRTEVGYFNLLASRRDATTGDDVLVDSHIGMALLTVAFKAFPKDRPSAVPPSEPPVEAPVPDPS